VVARSFIVSAPQPFFLSGDNFLAYAYRVYILLMLVAINVGNTHTGVGLFDEEKLVATTQILTPKGDVLSALFAPVWAWNLENSPDPDGSSEVAIASVVPTVTRDLVRICERNLALEPLVISGKLAMPMVIRYDDPAELGADRLCNALAAKVLYWKPGRPVVVVDIGTATTFDVISAKGDFVGGAIAPGPITALESLVDKTAQLFDINFEPPSRGVIATNTEDALKAGVFWGAIGGISSMLVRISDELGSTTIVVVCGGMAEIIAQNSSIFHHRNENLTLHGIRIAHSLSSLQ